jgi:hypothetical protein
MKRGNSIHASTLMGNPIQLLSSGISVENWLVSTNQYTLLLYFGYRTFFISQLIQNQFFR